MNPFAIRLQNAYFRANAASIESGKGRLRKGQFMQTAYPDQKYKNEASARRQFNKVVSGQTTGQRIEKRGGVPKVVHEHIFGKKKGESVAGGREGLWKVIVYGNTEQNGGPETDTTKSFVMQSAQYTTLEDLPYLQLIVPGITEEWLGQLDYPLYACSGSCYLQHKDPYMHWDIIPIRRHGSGEVFDLDEIVIG